MDVHIDSIAYLLLRFQLGRGTASTHLESKLILGGHHPVY